MSLFNLLLVAIAGSLLRAKILFPLPWIDHRFLLHAHSHFAFSGWLVQLISVFVVEWLAARTEVDHSLIGKLLVLNLLASYGMLFTFPFVGYAAPSIFFSTLSILYNSWFGILCLVWISRCQATKPVKLLFRVAMVSLMLSGLGPLALPVSKVLATRVNLEIPLVYWFLHFQYNGFFLFSVAGLHLSSVVHQRKTGWLLYAAVILMTIALVPAYFLSLQWLELPASLQAAAVTAGILQLLALGLFGLASGREGCSNVYFGLAATAFTLKILFQFLSIFPTIGNIAFGFRPIVIGYLHLVLLGCVSLFLIGYLRKHWSQWSGHLNRGGLLFASSVVINELLLFAQGYCSLRGVLIPYASELLFGAALLMLAGLVVVNLSLQPGRLGGDKKLPVTKMKGACTQ